ncbi:protein of unknown function (plasmid) [Caballeronia sp. S22]
MSFNGQYQVRRPPAHSIPLCNHKTRRLLASGNNRGYCSCGSFAWPFGGPIPSSFWRCCCSSSAR